MSKTNHAPGKLSAVGLKHLKDGWHSDGGNLYLFVRGMSKAWVFRFVAPNRQRRNMGIGSLSNISLAEARKVAATLRSQLKHPISPVDPLAARQDLLIERQLAAGKQMTFRSCAAGYIEAHRAKWKSKKHVQQWENTLQSYADPVFGHIPIDQIDETLILKVLLPIWTSKTETATRLRGRIEAVMDWATFSKFREGENPARWKGHLEHSLPNPSKIARVTHHPALAYRDMPDFMSDLATRKGLAARAVELLIFTAARSGEVRLATWGEFDLVGKQWVIPSTRMKMGRDHRVALSDAAIELLSKLPTLSDTELVFPGTKIDRPMSDMTLMAVLKRMGRTNITIHGFRSTFRDWAAEATEYANEAAELALAHAISNKVEAAYRRGDMLEKRFRMMNDWASHCKEQECKI
ncbi:MAG: integrase [Flavobacterium sp.]|jgi:integrase